MNTVRSVAGRAQFVCAGAALFSALQFGSGGCSRLFQREKAEEEKTYFAEGARPAPDDLLAVYRRLGYTNVADWVERSALPCLELRKDTRPPAERSKLGSRIGGRPNLPDPALWPAYNGTNLSFIAQLNLAELPDGPAATNLPRRGLLYFFYDAHQGQCGFDPKDKGSWRVLYAASVPDTTALTEIPSDVPEDGRYKEVPVRPVASRSFRMPDQEFLDGLKLEEAKEDEINDVFYEYAEKAVPGHQVLGHPGEIQGAMELECQLASHGVYCGNAEGYSDPRAKDLEKGAADWRLLLQVDTDDDAGMMWGDGGRLYFWIPRASLAQRRFEDVWMILQCY
jgi:uncharacterized protein YwqG